MTRDEAIEQLKQIPIYDGVSDDYMKTIYEAIDMAIEALKQQPCEDENIATAFQFGIAMGFAEKHDEMDRVMKEVKKAVMSRPKTGHWIENAPEYQNIDPPYICSECGNMHLRKTNYCDQCGARMVNE